jgi:ferric-dicitrate binding protein FerR (iron transport regulator)
MNTIDKDQNGKDDKVLEELFKHVSSRERAPQEVEQKIREALHGEWTQATRQRRTRKKMVTWAIAASVVLSVFVLTEMLRQPAPQAQRISLATVEKKTGEVFVQATGEQVSKPHGSEHLLTGDELSTRDGSRVALSWANGESIRIDQNSRVALISESEIKLLTGKIYIDSAGALIKNKPFRILTPTGPVSHMGTQYITVVIGDEVTVKVRKGEVSVGAGENRAIAIQGQKLHVSGAGQRSVTTIPVYGEDWLWAEQLAPQFNMDGHTLKELLDWVGRETGRKIEYDSAESELAAAQTRLHGNLDLEPLRAMDLMLQTSDLTSSVQDGVILVSL